MKTIVCEAPHLLRLANTRVPKPKAGEALVRIRRIGICGTDLHAYRGQQPFFTYPRILGHELAGSIEEIGDSPHGLAAGDKVAVMPYLECGDCIACRRGKPNCCANMRVLGVHLDGGMREYFAVPADHLIKANSLSLDRIALVECLAIAAHAAGRAEVVPDEYALVIGAGPIGLGLLQFARLAGAKVIAMDISRQRLRHCREVLGVKHVVDASKKTAAVRLAEITSGDSPTLVFDATGNAESMNRAFSHVAPGGRYVMVGVTKTAITFDDPDFHCREMTLMGSRNASRENFRQVISAIRRGAIETKEFVTHRCSFSDMIECYPSWLSPDAGLIKALVEV